MGAISAWNDIFRGFGGSQYKTLHVVNRHYLESSGLVRRVVQATIEANEDGAEQFLWRVPLLGAAAIMGAWPLAGTDVPQSLVIGDIFYVASKADPSLAYRDLTFGFAALKAGQVRTISFEYVLSGFAISKRRRWLVFENETTYSFAYKAAFGTKSIAFFIHLPSGASSYGVTTTLGEPVPFVEDGRYVLGFVDGAFDSKGDQAGQVVARTRNSFALPITTLATSLAIAFVQISAKGYTLRHATVAVAIGVLGASALRLAVQPQHPRRF